MHNKRFFDFVNFLLDVCFSKIRVLFFPFYVTSKFLIMLRSVYYIGVNEFQKGKFSECGRGVRLNGRVSVSGAFQMVVGNNVHINDRAFIRAEGGVVIGDNVHISRNFTLYSRNHRYEGDLLPYDSVNIAKPVTIGHNVWIGINVSIAPGVNVGEGAIIGMGVVLTTDVEPFEIVVPVKPIAIGKRDEIHYSSLVEKAQFGGASGYINRSL
ncbi:acyltransferase [Marinobacter sp. M-5]|uniref:acyltransferase n=1 Tax=Marinobacter sp. M-5 TaxID=3081089 RepID=UPI00293CFCE6|nr:acyltransferase [Marinobacter sp. M-5]MDV3503074.1 acyltransferase [Marinobacter sp. M-5]